MSITIPSGIATDKSNNANSSKTITIGVNEPEGTGDSEVVDVVKPIWTVKNVNTVFENGVTKAMMDLIATDKYFSNMLVTDEQLEEQIQILDGDGVAINAPELVKELSAPTFIKWDSETETYTSNVPESEANGVKYTLSKFTKGATYDWEVRGAAEGFVFGLIYWDKNTSEQCSWAYMEADYNDIRRLQVGKICKVKFCSDYCFPKLNGFTGNLVVEA